MLDSGRERTVLSVRDFSLDWRDEFSEQTESLLPQAEWTRCCFSRRIVLVSLVSASKRKKNVTPRDDLLTNVCVAVETRTASSERRLARRERVAGVQGNTRPMRAITT